MPAIRFARSSALAPALLLRTLRLNCLTTAYADLWAELYDDAWRDEHWACSTGPASRHWRRQPDVEHDTPLRTERERRAALVEIDALVAVWLGIDADAADRHLPRPLPGPRPTTRRSPGSTPTARKIAGYTGTRSAQARPRSTGSSSRRTWRTRRRTRLRTDTRRRSTRPTGSPSTGRRMPPLPSA